ncbi:hypothetical protein KIPB_002865 [Kipferlia bialata]|uniref:Uncharacterized protein n=1 Tax=Kipferlia bialata TaxID=797122 RepID=A0A9K3GGJ0_9EUKA|nr:hypothetical protein KIPB_002865 [Kipferlia bialata]|eukprot:g2865.t1
MQQPHNSIRVHHGIPRHILTQRYETLEALLTDVNQETETGWQARADGKGIECAFCRQCAFNVSRSKGRLKLSRLRVVAGVPQEHAEWFIGSGPWVGHAPAEIEVDIVPIDCPFYTDIHIRHDCTSLAECMRTAIGLQTGGSVVFVSSDPLHYEYHWVARFRNDIRTWTFWRVPETVLSIDNGYWGYLRSAFVLDSGIYLLDGRRMTLTYDTESDTWSSESRHRCPSLGYPRDYKSIVTDGVRALVLGDTAYIFQYAMVYAFTKASGWTVDFTDTSLDLSYWEPYHWVLVGRHVVVFPNTRTSVHRGMPYKVYDTVSGEWIRWPGMVPKDGSGSSIMMGEDGLGMMYVVSSSGSTLYSVCIQDPLHAIV